MMKSIIISIIYFVLYVKSTLLNWQLSEKQNIVLPSSVQIYRINSNNTIFHSKLTGVLAKFDLTDQNLQFKVAFAQNQKFSSPMRWAEEENNVVYGVINGGFFDGINNKTQSFICSNNHVHRPNLGNNTQPKNVIFPTIGTLGLLQNGSLDIQWVYSFTESYQTYTYTKPNPYPGPQPLPQEGQWWNIKQGIGAGPILIKNRKIIEGNPQNFNQSIVGKVIRQPRSGTCIDEDGKLILISLDGRYGDSDGVTLNQFAIALKDLGCVDALNLDGGGSSLLYADNQILNHFSDIVPRRVVSAIVIKDRFKKKNNQIAKQYEYVSELKHLRSVLIKNHPIQTPDIKLKQDKDNDIIGSYNFNMIHNGQKIKIYKNRKILKYQKQKFNFNKQIFK